MATWVLRSTPWCRVRSPLDLGWSNRMPIITSKHYFSTPYLSEDSPFMAEMKRQRYPSVPVDTSIFEDPRNDYELYLSGTAQNDTQASLNAIHPSAILENLVEEGDLHDAERVLTELTDMGVTIEPSLVYAKAAIHELERGHENREARLKAFVKWWRLIPDAWLTTGSDTVKRVQSMLFNETVPDLPLITQFALVSVSKGYATTVSLRVVVDVVRYAPPIVSIPYLDGLYRAALGSLEHKNAGVSHHEGKWPGYFEICIGYWYSAAIKAYCASRRVGEAIQTLRTARSRTIPIRDYAYTALRRHLQQTLDSQNLSFIEELYQTQIREHEGGESHPDAAVYAPAYQLSKDLSAEALFPDKKSLAAALRIMRHNMSPLTFPLPSTLATFMEAYKSTGHSIALRILRQRAYQEYPTTSMWALAEMLYHFRRDENHLVLAVFGHHFHMVGVPQRAMRYVHRTMLRIEREGRESLAARNLILYPQLPLREKLWPSTHHTALVWRVLSRYVFAPQKIEELYQEFLSHVNGIPYSDTAGPQSPQGTGTTKGQIPGQSEEDFGAQTVFRIEARTEGRSENGLDGEGAGQTEGKGLPRSSYPTCIAPRSMYDSAHFNVFVYVFGQRSGPTRAARVVADMYRLGTSPSIETLTMLVSSFARIGAVNKLFTLLKRMEETLDEARSQQARPPRQTGDSQFPSPNIVTYTAVIRYLMEASKLDYALHVARRMKRKLKYKPGKNPITDQVLSELALRRNSQPASSGSPVGKSSSPLIAKVKGR